MWDASCFSRCKSAFRETFINLRVIRQFSVGEYMNGTKPFLRSIRNSALCTRAHLRNIAMQTAEKGREEIPEANGPPQTGISGIFAIVKPSGRTSMDLLDTLKPLLASSEIFRSRDDGHNQGGKKRKRGGRGNASTPKLGQGGTLDPLADGVLVVGVGSGTKRLQEYLDCSKEYRTTALLGASTLSYDSQDPVLHYRPYAHVTQEMVRSVLPSFVGKGMQYPPLYSAIKIDGKRLFDYAREGLDLPRPIEKRQIHVHNLDLVEWIPSDRHMFEAPQEKCSEEEKALALRARKMAGIEDGETIDEEGLNVSNVSNDEVTGSKAPAFTLDMTVSSGTYVRSIVHDVGQQLKSAAHVVRLSRIRQGKWVTPDYLLGEKDNGAKNKDVEKDQVVREAIPWQVFQDAILRMASEKKRPKNQDTVSSSQIKYDDTKKYELAEWEKLILERMDRC